MSKSIFVDNSVPYESTPKEYSNRMLTLSGGGMKGLLQLEILAWIEDRTGKSISELFPIIAGTSVGGLIAALLTIPEEPGSTIPKYTAKQALEIFVQAAPDIFPAPPLGLKFLGTIKQLFTDKYDEKPLEKILEQYLGDLRMNETTSELIVPVADVHAQNGGMKIFCRDSYAQHVPVEGVIRATTAAPTYFKPVIIKGNAAGPPICFADGGVGANDPVISALARLRTREYSPEEKLELIKNNDFTPEQEHKILSIRQPLSSAEQQDILSKTQVVSINFHNADPHTSAPSGGGIFKWGLKLLNVLFDNSEYTATTEVQIDLPGKDQFVEISLPVTKETSSLDDSSPKNIKALQDIAKKYINDHADLLDTMCQNLLHNIEMLPQTNADTEQLEEENIDAGGNIAITNPIDKDHEEDIDEGFEEGPEEKNIGTEINTTIKTSVSEGSGGDIDKGFTKANIADDISGKSTIMHLIDSGYESDESDPDEAYKGDEFSETLNPDNGVTVEGNDDVPEECC